MFATEDFSLNLTQRLGRSMEIDNNWIKISIDVIH